MRMKTFDTGGVDYGPDETAELRKGLIGMRDAYLKQNDFGAAILLSHTIGLIYAMGKEVWGDEFKPGLPEATGAVK